MTFSEVESVSGYVGNFKVRVRQKPRYVDEDLCTGCGQCEDVCPIEVTSSFDVGLSKRKAIYRNFAQATPNAFAVDKRGIAPCREACPIDQRAMGYIALAQQKRFADAYWAIRRENPFPSVCGRVCNHLCEDACSRSEYDEPVNVMAIKRFIGDWAYKNRDQLPDMRDKSIAGTPFKHAPSPTHKKVAVIGAGPAGLTAALDLVRLGHSVKVFDSYPVAGGMMRVGIPPHRLPPELLDWEIQQILDEGVELQLNTWIDDIQGLLSDDYAAVMIATGAHKAIKLSIRNSNHPDNWLSVDFLRKVFLGEEIDLSDRDVIVLGAGDVALDVARTAVRLGEPKVKIVCRGMRASFNEIEETEIEGVEIIKGRVFKSIIIGDDEKIIGVECLEAHVGGIVDGRRIVEEIPSSEHIIKGDLIIWALGQHPDFSFLPQDGSINTRYPVGLQADDEMMTTMEGVFTAGDVHRGATFFVVDAIAEGHKVALCIDRYLQGEKGLLNPPKRTRSVQMSKSDVKVRIEQGLASDQSRVKISTIHPEERRNNFREVDLTLTEAEVLTEAARCLECGVCAECMECVSACDKGAIDHDMQERIEEINVGAIILATGFKDFDPDIAKEYGSQLPNVITAMEFERLINPSGPTGGKVLLENGERPRSVAILHCVGSRDEKYHEYCSRACCMYSLKLAQLVREYVDADVYEIYRDMRTFGKGYEEFYNRIKMGGVEFYHGRVNQVAKQNGHLVVNWKEKFFGQPDKVEVDMIILATGFEPQLDAGKVARTFGISRGRDGFFLEKHPKLGPVETTTDGIFIAGACQSPKDIPDSVAQAGASAAAALSLIDQGTVVLDPSVAETDPMRCAGCGQCITACPYDAISLMNGIADVNTFQCKGCGTCAASCPNKAMTLIHFEDHMLVSELIGALR